MRKSGLKIAEWKAEKRRNGNAKKLTKWTIPNLRTMKKPLPIKLF